MDAEFRGDPADFELYIRLLKERDGVIPAHLRPKSDPEVVQKRRAVIETLPTRKRRRAA